MAKEIGKPTQNVALGKTSKRQDKAERKISWEGEPMSDLGIRLIGSKRSGYRQST